MGHPGKIILQNCTTSSIWTIFWAIRLNLNKLHSKNDSLSWGTGFWTGTKSGVHYSMNIEMGYMFKLRKKPFSRFSRNYIGRRTGYRIGISAGAQMFVDEPIQNDIQNLYNSDGYGIFCKTTFNSPVLLNFISFSWQIKAMYTIPKSDIDHNIKGNRMVFGYGNDIEFWIWENACVTLGYTDENDQFFGHKDDPVYPSRLRFVFGMKTFY